MRSSAAPATKLLAISEILCQAESILQDIPPAVVIAAIKKRQSMLALAPGQIFVTAGESAPGLYLIMQGTIELFTRDAAQREKVIDFARVGDTLAAETLFGERAISYSARSLTSASLIHLPDRLVGDWAARYPAFGRRLMQHVAQRIDYLLKDMLTLRSKKATARLVCYLVCHFDKAPRTPDGTHSLQIDIPKNRLASRLGITDCHLSRALRELQDQGLLVAQDDDESGYFIPDVAALSKYVCPMGCVL